MDTRIAEFSKIHISKYVPELDLLNSPVLNSQEKEFLAELYDFIETWIFWSLRTPRPIVPFCADPTGIPFADDRSAEALFSICSRTLTAAPRCRVDMRQLRQVADPRRQTSVSVPLAVDSTR